MLAGVLFVNYIAIMSLNIFNPINSCGVGVGVVALKCIGVVDLKILGVGVVNFFPTLQP